MTGSNCSTYLFRTIHSGIEQERELSIGSDDSFKIWINGKLVADKYISRGLAPDQDKVKVRLAKGEVAVYVERWRTNKTRGLMAAAEAMLRRNLKVSSRRLQRYIDVEEEVLVRSCLERLLELRGDKE